MERRKMNGLVVVSKDKSLAIRLSSEEVTIAETIGMDPDVSTLKNSGYRCLVTFSEAWILEDGEDPADGAMLAENGGIMTLDDHDYFIFHI